MALRHDKMTSNERIEALLKRQPVDRVPVTSFGGRGFCCRNVGYTIGDGYSDLRKAFSADTWTAEQYSWDLIPHPGYSVYGAWEFGGDIKWPSGDYMQGPAVMRYPVATEEEAQECK